MMEDKPTVLLATNTNHSNPHKSPLLTKIVTRLWVGRQSQARKLLCLKNNKSFVFVSIVLFDNSLNVG